MLCVAFTRSGHYMLSLQHVKPWERLVWRRWRSLFSQTILQKYNVDTLENEIDQLLIRGWECCCAIGRWWGRYTVEKNKQLCHGDCICWKMRGKDLDKTWRENIGLSWIFIYTGQYCTFVKLSTAIKMSFNGQSVRWLSFWKKRSGSDSSVKGLGSMFPCEMFLLSWMYWSNLKDKLSFMKNTVLQLALENKNNLISMKLLKNRLFACQMT